LTSDKGRVVDAAMQLAAERAWSDISMRDIAEAVGIGLDGMRKHFGSKTQILTAYIRAVDDHVLKSLPQREAGESARDLLFEVLMARLDAMTPYKSALKSIAADTTVDSGLIGAMLNSQRWMLMAAGLDGDGPRGVLRSTGLASLFTSVFQVWLDDDDPGMARTMAILDRRLRRAENAMSTVDQVAEGLDRLRSAVLGGVRRAGARARRSDETSGRDAGDDEPGFPSPDGDTTMGPGQGPAAPAS